MFTLQGYERFGQTELATFLEEEFKRMSDESGFALSEMSRLYVVDICLRVVNDFSFLPDSKNEVKKAALEEALELAMGGVTLLATQNWRQYGDVLLFRTGYFPDSFKDEETRARYMWVGKKAYQRTIQKTSQEHHALAVMGELSRKFPLIGSILTEIRISGEEQKPRSDAELFDIQRHCAVRETAKLVYSRTLEKYRGVSSLFSQTLQ